MKATGDLIIPSLNQSFSSSEINTSLTEAGLLVDHTEAIAQLYAEHLSWKATKKAWHEGRVSGRGSRHSAQKIFRIIRDRLQVETSSLASVPALANLLKHCFNETSKAQTLYLYLLVEDNLLRSVVHELLNDQGIDQARWDLSSETLTKYIKSLSYKNGKAIKYADSTTHRWIQGLRSVFRDIGVLANARDQEGKAPILDDIPLHCSAVYDWQKQGKSWAKSPTTWAYLLQSPIHWDTLRSRLLDTNRWETHRFQNVIALKPKKEDRPFQWNE